MIDYYGEATGLSSMQRTTGWQLSIVAAMMARSETPVGSIPLETAVPGDAFVLEARKRGFTFLRRSIGLLRIWVGMVFKLAQSGYL